jgi:hypothetical protein
MIVKCIKPKLLLVASIALSAAHAANATLADVDITYSVQGASVLLANGQVTLGAYTTTIDLVPNSATPLSSELNSLSWSYGANAPSLSSATVARQFSISSPSGLTPQSLMQPLSVQVLAPPSANLQLMELGTGAPLIFSWAAAGMNYDLVVLALPTLLLNTSGSPIPGTVGGDFLLSETPAVPEPTTIFAGAALLLPFGASMLRSFRKKRS